MRAPELPRRLTQQPARQQVSPAKRAESIDEDQIQILFQPPVLERVVQDARAHAKSAHRFCRRELAPFADYFGGRPRNAGLILKVVPDDIMRGLELRKGTIDIGEAALIKEMLREVSNNK